MDDNFRLPAMPELAPWNTFYEIVGTAAATLIGLQFIMMSLIAQRPTLRAPDANAAFGTPTIVHFTTALMLSALMAAPWPSIDVAAVVWEIIGIGGLFYALIVTRRMLRQTAYLPVFEDWLFHTILPIVAYAILALSSFAAATNTHEALFGIGAAVLLMLLVGIHNAYDSVAYHVYSSRFDPPRN
jgi:hypothetical protein